MASDRAWRDRDCKTMSCCNECEQTGGSCNQGFGLLGQVGPVVGSYVLADTVVRWSGFIREGGYAITPFTQPWKDVIEGCLYQSGGFWNVEASASGNTVTITAQVANDFAKLEDVFNLIVGQLWECAGLGVTSNGFQVVSVPAGTPNDNRHATPYPVNVPSGVSPVTLPDGSQRCPDGYYDASYFKGIFGLDCQKLPDKAVSPSQCNWDAMSWGDYLACQLGIKPSQAVIVGALGAVAGLFLISKIAK